MGEDDKATADPLASKDKSSATAVHSPKQVEIVYRRKNKPFLRSPLKKKQHKRALLDHKKVYFPEILKNSCLQSYCVFSYLKRLGTFKSLLGHVASTWMHNTPHHKFN